MPVLLFLPGCEVDPPGLTDSAAPPSHWPEPGPAPAPDLHPAEVSESPYACPRGEPDPGCLASVEETTPPARATGVDADEPVTFWLSAEDRGARASLDGVAGTSHNFGERVVFEPDEPLASNAPYVARLCSCDVETTLTFTTGVVLGTPVADPGRLVGRTWSFDLSTGRYVTPSGLEPLFAGHMTGALLVEAQGAEGATLELRQGWSAGGAQDVCSATVDAAVDFTSNPDVQLGPVDGSFPNLGPTRTFGATLTGTFTAEGHRVEDATWTALVDTAPWGLALTPADPDAFCALLPPFGAACESCPDGAGTCLRFTLDGVVGLEVSPLPLAEVTGPCAPEVP